MPTTADGIGRATAILFVASIAGCAGNPRTPPGWLPEPDEAGSDAYGAWADLEFRNGSRLSGELISVDRDSVLVLPSTRPLTAIASTDVARARIVKYRPQTGRLVATSVIGAASTLSNGYFLIFTAPLWGLTGWFSVRFENRASRLEVPPRSWDEARDHARFPQGWPENLDRSQISPRPVRPR